ncbi:MAG: hypothetical protein ACXVRK_03385 [Gaiellaceae bacterium]
MVTGYRLFLYWMVSGLIALGFWAASSGRPSGLWIVTGLIFLGWGVPVATNWRGAADAMPKTTGFGPFRTTTSPAMLRLIFSGFALSGTVILIAGVVALAR